MNQLHYVRPVRLSKLHDELLAAGIAPDPIEATRDGTEAWITVEDTIDPAAVSTVVDAHDATTPAPPTNEQVLGDRLRQALANLEPAWNFASLPAATRDARRDQLIELLVRCAGRLIRLEIQQLDQAP